MMIKKFTVFVVDRDKSLYANSTETEFIGTEEQVKRLCKQVNGVIVQLTNKYDVFFDYKEVQ